MFNPHELTEKYGLPVDEEMARAFANAPSFVPAYSMSEYHMGWLDEKLNRVKSPQGKMLRPVLCLLAYEIFDDGIEKAVPLAASIELYHNHTLVMDDMQDGDRYRRGRPTVWSLWGIGQGINAGLILGYFSQRLILGLRSKGFPEAKIFTLLESMTGAMLEVAEGQSMDLDFETRPAAGENDYMTMIGKKTGALVGFSTFGGAYLAQDNAALAEKFKIFGRKLGVAMQIRDDLIGIWGDTRQSGKEIAKDLVRRKKTFPVFKALHLLQGKDLDAFHAYLSAKNEADEKTVGNLLRILEKDGIREICGREADKLMDGVYGALWETGLSKDKLAAIERYSRHAFESIGTLRPAESSV